MKIRKIFLSLLLVAGLTACQPKETMQEASTSTTGKASTETTNKTKDGLQKFDKVYYNYFDTVTSFSAYAKDEDQFKEYTDILETELEKYHEFFNSYYDFEGINNIKTLNESAGKGPIEVDPAIIEMLEYSIDFYEKTDGKINIGLGNVIKLWHNAREESLADEAKAWVPTKDQLVEAAKHSDINQIKIDKENSTVEILDPDMTIDVGAIGKGFAAKKIEEAIRKAGIKNAIISIGGDDVIIGDNPVKENGLWKIAIQNPDLSSQEAYSSVISLKNSSVVTSGDYQRFYEVNGKKYHHIIDPDTLYPSKYFKSVTVVHDDIALADALSTYLFIVDLDKGMQIAKDYDAQVLWIDQEGKQYKTEGYEELEI